MKDNNFVPPKASTTYEITTLDAVILMYHLTRGAEFKDIGFEDMDQTLGSLRQQLQRTIKVSEPTLESCLWSCNLMHEQREFWHPDKLRFIDFVRKVIPNGRYFDRYYNFITDKKPTDRSVDMKAIEEKLK